MKHIKLFENFDNKEYFPSDFYQALDLIEGKLLELGINYYKQSLGSNRYIFFIIDYGKDKDFSFQVWGYQNDVERKTSIVPTSNAHPTEYIYNMDEFMKFLGKKFNINIGKIMKKINENNSDSFPNDIKKCAKMVEDRLDEFSINYQLYKTSLTNDEVINYTLFTRSGETVIICIEEYNGKTIIIGDYPKSYEEDHKDYYPEDHTFLKHCNNWKEFHHYLAQINNINIGKIMKKINEDWKSEIYDLPRNIKELEKLFENYIDKLKISYDVQHRHEFGETKIDYFIKKYHIILKTVEISNSGETVGLIEFVSPIELTCRNLESLEDNLAKHILGINVSKIMKKINENNSDKFPKTIEETDKMISSYLKSMGVRFKKRKNEYIKDIIKYSIYTEKRFRIIRFSIREHENWGNVKVKNNKLGSPWMESMDDFILWLGKEFNIDVGNIMKKINK